MRKDYYSILEVSKNCNQEEIKAAFRKKAMQLHPDKNHSPKAREAFTVFTYLADAYVES